MKRKYHYFVSYFFASKEGNGYGNVLIDATQRICSKNYNESMNEIKDNLIKKNNYDNISVINFIEIK